jgi:hypothetical protein
MTWTPSDRFWSRRWNRAHGGFGDLHGEPSRGFRERLSSSTVLSLSAVSYWKASSSRPTD